MSTSATGGYLQATSSNAIEDESLRVFFQNLVAGITGITGALVRPRWQPEPPNMPAFGTDWAAIGVTSRTRDVNAYTTHRTTSDGQGGTINTDYTHRTEVLNVLCSFYGPNCESNSELLAMGLEVGQNREVMQLAGYGLVGVDDATMNADMWNEKWVTRIDLPFQIRRAQLYQYSVLNVIAAQGTIVDDSGAVNATIQVSQKPAFGFNTSSSIVSGFGVGNWIP
jgi:hypothetical protein